MSGSVSQATSATFADLTCGRFVLVAFWAAHCRPCLALHPVLEELARDPIHGIELVYVDVDVESDLAAAHIVLSLPTTIAFREGTPVGRTAAADKRSVVKFVHQFKPT